MGSAYWMAEPDAGELGSLTSFVVSTSLNAPQGQALPQQGCNPFALWGKMTPTTNLEPTILVVGCELELALK